MTQERLEQARREWRDHDNPANVWAHRHADFLLSELERALKVVEAAKVLVDGMPYTMGEPGEGQHNALRAAVEVPEGGPDA